MDHHVICQRQTVPHFWHPLILLIQGLAIDIGSFGGSPSTAHYFISLQADTGLQARNCRGGVGGAEAGDRAADSRGGRESVGAKTYQQ